MLLLIDFGCFALILEIQLLTGCFNWLDILIPNFKVLFKVFELVGLSLALLI